MKGIARVIIKNARVKTTVFRDKNHSEENFKGSGPMQKDLNASKDLGTKNC